MIEQRQWAAFAAMIDEGWAYRFEPATEDAWRLALEGFPAEEVGQALQRLLVRGGPQRPQLAEVIAEIRRDPTRPTFSEAIQLIFEPGGVLAARTTVRKATWDDGERDKLNDLAAWDRAGEMHPLLAAFVRSQGLRRLRRIANDLEGDYGGARRHELEVAWSEFVDTNEHRELALESGPRSAGDLQRIDPLAALKRAGQLIQLPAPKESAA